VRSHFKAAVCERRQPRDLHVNHTILILQRAFDKKKLASRHYQAEAFIKAWRVAKLQGNGPHLLRPLAESSA
jgi:hypothetical protein